MPTGASWSACRTCAESVEAVLSLSWVLRSSAVVVVVLVVVVADVEPLELREVPGAGTV